MVFESFFEFKGDDWFFVFLCLWDVSYVVLDEEVFFSLDNF